MDRESPGGRSGSDLPNRNKGGLTGRRPARPCALRAPRPPLHPELRAAMPDSRARARARPSAARRGRAAFVRRRDSDEAPWRSPPTERRPSERPRRHRLVRDGEGSNV